MYRNYTSIIIKSEFLYNLGIGKRLSNDDSQIRIWNLSEIYHLHWCFFVVVAEILYGEVWNQIATIVFQLEIWCIYFNIIRNSSSRYLFCACNAKNDIGKLIECLFVLKKNWNSLFSDKHKCKCDLYCQQFYLLGW